MGKVCNRCGNMVADNMMFCNKCGCMLEGSSLSHCEIGTPSVNKTKDYFTYERGVAFLKKYRKQSIIAGVAMVLLLVVVIIFGSTPKVVGAWEMSEGSGWDSDKWIVHINKDTIVFLDGSDTEIYPIKIKGDEIFIDLSQVGKGENIWKYQIEGNSILVEWQGYTRNGDWSSEFLSGVRVDSY